MSNLIEQLIGMETGGLYDAILLQKKQSNSNGAPNYFHADAIIRRIRTPGGWKWAFHSLISARTGSGQYFDDINDLAASVERQIGIKSDIREWVGVDYCDPDFPSNLIP